MTCISTRLRHHISQLFLLMIFLYLFLLTGTVVFGQEIKDPLTEARILRDNQHFEEAVEYYSKALEINPGSYECFIERAHCKEKLNRYDEAINDYKLALNLKPGEIDLYRKALIDYLQIENYNQATEMFATMVIIKNKTVAAYQGIAVDKIKLQDYDGAIKELNTALDYDNTGDYSHFLKGVAMDSLHNYQVAVQCYLKAISSMYLSKEYKEATDKERYVPYFYNLALAQRKLGYLDESIKNLNTAVTYNPGDEKLYCQRGISYLQKSDLLNAQSDFDKAVSLNNKYAPVFHARGILSMKQEKYNDAIGDFSNAILFDQAYYGSYLERGKCYEKLNKYAEAIVEYKEAQQRGADKKACGELIATARQKLFEFNKEANKPEVLIAGVKSKTDTTAQVAVKVPKNKQTGLIKGNIHDQSEIKSILVDGVPAVFSNEEKNPSFTVQIPVENKDKITVEVTDVYLNTTTQTYDIIRTEANVPKVTLSSPFITFDKEIIPDNLESPVLFVEGKVEDESQVSEILINGVKVSFNSEILNPAFSANVDITGKDTLTISVSDIYDNRKLLRYFINWTIAKEEADNPMGRTWVVFIENSDYTNLPSLEGSKQDVTSMRQALANYHISKVIHKSNLTKSQMDKFFSIELRDMINRGHVQSLMVWFAGHGRFINETGYWLPVDATKTDEYTYFPITSLKGYLSLYKLRHTLIISDACETGPAFYLAMRGDLKDRDCNDWEATKLKSAQVYTSSDREKASDNSIFTKTFSQVLMKSPDKCISIEKITEKVTKAVEMNQKQKPKFGNISGLEDQNGTFFFMRK